MIKDKINIVVSNSKLSIFGFKINLNIIKRFFILTIDNKYNKNISI